MRRYLLRYRGTGPRPSDVPGMIRPDDGLRLLEAFGDGYVVEGEKAAVDAFLGRLSGWFSAPVKQYGRPKIGAARHGRIHRLAV